MQMHAHAARGTDIGQGAFDGAGEMQIVPEGVFNALQRDIGVIVRHFAEVEEDVVQRLQEVVAAFRANQIHLLMGVINTLARLHVHKRDGATLIVSEVNKLAAAAQALFPRQYPTLTQHTIDGQVAGVKARPVNRHQAGEAEIGFVRDDFTPRGGVHGIARKTTNRSINRRPNDVAAGHFTRDEPGSEFHDAGHDGFHASLSPSLDQLGNTTGSTGHGHEDVDGGAQPPRNLVIYRKIAMRPAGNENVARATGNGCATSEFVALARGGGAVDENVGGTFRNLYRARVLVARTDALLNMSGLSAVDENIWRGSDDGAGGRRETTPYRLSCRNEQATPDACRKTCQ